MIQKSAHDKEEEAENDLACVKSTQGGRVPRKSEQPQPKEENPTHNAPGEGSALDKPILATRPKATLNIEAAGKTLMATWNV